MKLNEPAMPLMEPDGYDRKEQSGYIYHPGFTKCEYAAIHLCVPMSGNDELDAMIRRAQRERLAGQIIMGLVTNPNDEPSIEPNTFTTSWCYQVADAVIAAGEIK
jgi:hypothetical protein